MREGQKIGEKDVVAWYIEGVEYLMESEELVDEQVKMAIETVQWMIDKNYVDRTEEGLELAALAQFRQASLATFLAQSPKDGCDAKLNPGIDWTRTAKGGNSAARKRTQRAKRQ